MIADADRAGKARPGISRTEGIVRAGKAQKYMANRIQIVL
jgi:hypothetical protein